MSPILLKIIINFRNSDVARNPFDCAGSQGVWSDRWVRDRDHVRSYYRILRRHERRHFYRPRRRRLSVAPVTAAVTASALDHRILKCSLSPERLAVQAGTGAPADREASMRANYSRQAATTPKAARFNARPLTGRQTSSLTCSAEDFSTKAPNRTSSRRPCFQSKAA